MGVGGTSEISIVSFRRQAVAERGRALYVTVRIILLRQNAEGYYCWYILVGLSDRRDGRAVEVALWTTGCNTFTMEAILFDLKENGEELR